MECICFICVWVSNFRNGRILGSENRVVSMREVTVLSDIVDSSNSFFVVNGVRRHVYQFAKVNVAELKQFLKQAINRFLVSVNELSRS
jgi:hypothetical protein